MSETKQELLPCPFCGEPHTHVDRSGASCHDYVSCSGCGTMMAYNRTSNDAIATWNTRASQWTKNPPTETGCYLYWNVKHCSPVVLHIEKDGVYGQLRFRSKEVNRQDRREWMTVFQLVVEDGKRNMLWQKITVPKITPEEEIFCDRCGNPANMFGANGCGGVCEKCEATLCEAYAQWDENGICKACHEQDILHWSSRMPTDVGYYRISWNDQQYEIFEDGGRLMIMLRGFLPNPLEEWLQQERKYEKRPLYWHKVELPPKPKGKECDV